MGLNGRGHLVDAGSPNPSDGVPLVRSLLALTFVTDSIDAVSFLGLGDVRRRAGRRASPAGIRDASASRGGRPSRRLLRSALVLEGASSRSRSVISSELIRRA